MQAQMKELILANPFTIGFIANFLIPLICLTLELIFKDHKWVFRAFGFISILILNPLLASLAGFRIKPDEQPGPGDYLFGGLMFIQAGLVLMIYCCVFGTILIRKFLDHLKQRRDANPGVH
jgi:hypothetical protein